MKRKICFLTMMMFLLIMFLRTPAGANPVKQSQPVAQCTQGILMLFMSGDPDLALPLLEAGFAAREEATAAEQEMVNMCALLLGALHHTAGNWPEALEVYDYALQGFRASGQQQLEWAMLYAISAVYTVQGDYPKALELLTQALSLSQQADESWVPQTMPLFAEAVTQNNIGYVYALQGHYEQAQQEFEAAEGVLERYDQQTEQSGGLEELVDGISTGDELNPEVLGQLLFDLLGGGEPSEGLTFEELLLASMFGQAREIVKVVLLNNRGEMYRLQGRYDEAVASFNEALTLLRQEDDASGGGLALPSLFTAGPVNEGLVLNNLGLVYVDQKQYPEGLDYLQQARVSMKESENLAGEVAVLGNIGSLYALQEDYEEALTIFEEALALAAENGPLQAEVHTNIGSVYYARGHYSQALDSFQHALVRMQEAGNRPGEALALGNLSRIYIAQGRYEQALKELEPALSIMREIGLLSGQALILNSIGALYQAQGHYEEALDYFGEALELMRVLGNQRDEAATLNNIGTVYRVQQAYEEADSTLDSALALMREVRDRDGEAITLNNLASVDYDQGRYYEAETNFTQALAIMEEIGNQAGQAQTLNNLAGVYQATGRYEEALQKYEKALTLHRQVGNRPGEGETLNNIGAVYLAQGRYGPAFDVLQQALEVRREMDSRRLIGESLLGIGSVYQVQGRYDEALQYFEDALEILREVKHRLGEATTLNNMGAILSAQEKYEEALQKYEEALAIQREIGDQAGLGLTLSNMGVALFEQSEEEHTKALALFEEALTIRRDIGDRDGEGQTLANIAAVYLAQGASSEALTHYQEALAIMKEAGDQVNQGLVLAHIGLIHEKQEQYNKALEYYEQAMTVYESARAVAGSELGRISFATQYVGLYEQAVRLYHAQGQDEQAFLTSERGRARGFLDALATGEVQLSDQAAAELLAKERELYASRQAIRLALAEARTRHAPESNLLIELEKQYTQSESTHASVLAQIEQLDEKLNALIPGRTKQVSLSEIQEQLDPNTTLLSYYILGNDETLAFILSPDELKVVALGVCCQDLTEQITAFYDSFTNPLLNQLDPHQSDELLKLYDWLITPLKAHLKTPSVTIVPHNILHYLPFAALTDGEKYLADDYVLSTVPSASVLPLIQQNRPPDTTIESILALGNPAFDPQLPQLEGQILPNLPSAKQEVESVSNLFGDKVDALFSTEATESAFRAAQANILHLAAHGIYKPDKPLSSMLVLASDTTNDGLLEVSEVYSLELKETSLIVLSACETGLQSLNKQQEGQSVVIAGDEIVALNRAFLFAGTPTVLSTLWSVYDAPSALLIERFYTHLQAGYGKAEALRQAQIDTRAEYPHPYYWAGFVLAGDAGEVTNFAPHEQANQATPTVAEPNETPQPVISTPMPTASTEDNGTSSSSRNWLWLSIGVAVLLGMVALIGISRRRAPRKGQDGRRSTPRRR